MNIFIFTLLIVSLACKTLDINKGNFEQKDCRTQKIISDVIKSMAKLMKDHKLHSADGSSRPDLPTGLTKYSLNYYSIVKRISSAFRFVLFCSIVS